VNPAWIALHYDAQNAQLHAAETTWHTYTPGIYCSDDEALESGADRKLALAFEVLRLERGQRLLEVGCGWGGMLRYSAQRGVQVTGLTLSRLQKEYVEQRIKEEQLPAQVRYQDFFTFQPMEQFDAISMMGVIEDLSDYRAVMRLLSRWLKPGGRTYLDFAAERKRFDTHSFVTKHIWPGTFRMVFMPEFMEALRESPFELIRVDNDRRNYHLWARGMYERWMRNRARIQSPIAMESSAPPSALRRPIAPAAFCAQSATTCLASGPRRAAAAPEPCGRNLLESYAATLGAARPQGLSRVVPTRFTGPGGRCRTRDPRTGWSRRSCTSGARNDAARGGASSDTDTSPGERANDGARGARRRTRRNPASGPR
jgi:cyclopropane fatty-acyl-phospholipid synthase-like methyltransferase